MPALGLAQETGLLVAWHKAVGEAVAADDILMEVETDKSTMEVEAGAKGYVAELRAEAGAEVPVGQVVAVISETPVDAQSAPAPAARADSPPAVAAPAAAKADAAPPANPAPPNPALAVPKMAAPPLEPAAALLPGGRVLASPKARRLAAEQGLDLSRLVGAGVAQPFRAADLDTLRRLPPAGAVAAAAVSHLVARVPAAGFDGFCAWLAEAAPALVDSAPVLAAFAAGALRTATGAERVTVRVARPTSGQTADYVDADRRRFTALTPEDGVPDLTLLDLSGGRIAAVRAGGGAGGGEGPTLSLTRSGDAYELALAFSEAQLPLAAALALLDAVAGRLDEPLRHLL